MFIDHAQLMCQDYFNLQPSEVKGSANISTDYEKRYLLQKLYSVFDFTLPKDWSLAFFRLLLFYNGSLAVIYTKEYGWIMSYYGVTKLTLYYRPAVIECYNQFLDSTKVGVIGANAEIVYAMDDRFGLDDLLTRYATKLAEIDKGINVNLMISTLGYMYAAPNKKTADSVTEAFGRATTGEPIVALCERNFKEGRSGLELFNPELKQNYLVQDLLIARRTLINNFLTEIGIASCNYDKKERLNTEEVTRNDMEADSLVHVMLRNIKDCFERINKISGLDLDVKLRRGGRNYGKADALGNAAMGQNTI